MKSIFFTLFVALAVTTQAQNLESYYAKVESLIAKHDFFTALDAIDILKKKCQSDTLQARYWTLLSTASYIANYHQDALKYIDKAIQVNPRHPDSYYTKARLVRQINKDTDESIRLLNTAIQLDNKMALFFSYRGYCLQEKGEYKKAEQDYAQAIKMGYQDQMTYRNYALLISRKPRGEKALIFIKKAIQMSPSGINYSILAKINFLLANPKATCANYEIAFSKGLNPNSADQIYHLICKNDSTPMQTIAELAVELKLWHTAIRAYTNLIEANRKNIDYYVHRGNSYFTLNQYTKAAKDYKNGLKLVTKHRYYTKSILLRNLGALYQELNKPQKANFYKNELLAMKKDSALIYLELGLRFYQEKKYNEAIEYFESALDSGSPINDHEVFTYKAWAELAINSFDDALDNAKLALVLNKDFAPAWLVLGHAKRRLKQKDYCAAYTKAAKLGNKEATRALKTYCKK